MLPGMGMMRGLSIPFQGEKAHYIVFPTLVRANENLLDNLIRYLLFFNLITM
jgi:hypothetical protein